MSDDDKWADPLADFDWAGTVAEIDHRIAGLLGPGELDRRMADALRKHRRKDD